MLKIVPRNCRKKTMTYRPGQAMRRQQGRLLTQKSMYEIKTSHQMINWGMIKFLCFIAHRLSVHIIYRNTQKACQCFHSSREIYKRHVNVFILLKAKIIFVLVGWSS